MRRVKNGEPRGAERDREKEMMEKKENLRMKFMEGGFSSPFHARNEEKG